MHLICHVTSQEQTTEGLSDVMCRSCSFYVTNLPSLLTIDIVVLEISNYFVMQVAKFGGHRHCGTGDILNLVCHVILQDQEIKGSCNFMGSSFSR